MKVPISFSLIKIKVKNKLKELWYIRLHTQQSNTDPFTVMFLHEFPACWNSTHRQQTQQLSTLL